MTGKPSPLLPVEAVDLIKQYETLKLDAYVDPVGIPTIGYGHTKGVRTGTSITPQQADEYLRHDLNEAQSDVLRNVKVPLNDNEYGALVSFVFNVGGPAFAQSRCLKLLNSGDRHAAANEMLRFCKGRVRGRKVVLHGLERRRRSEREMFLCTPGAVAIPASLHAVALPKPASRARRHIAAAAGVGGTIGIVPAIVPAQSFSREVSDLWNSVGGPPLPAPPSWVAVWIDRTMQHPRLHGVASVVAHAATFAQNHGVLMFVLGTLFVVSLRNKFLRFAQGI